MAYIGWAVNVNKKILDSTSVTVGESATIQDTLESGGLKKSRLSCANPPDVYEVTMEFDFVTKGEDGLTELERFYAWYKWAHCYGTNPFEFPAILLNSNRMNGYSVEETDYGSVPDTEYYCITSAVKGTKSGLCQQVTMTWMTYATGVISIPDESVTVDHIYARNGYVDIYLSGEVRITPSSSTYALYINGVNEPVTGNVFDMDSILRYYFNPKTVQGIYVVNVNGKEDSFTVGV